MKQQNGRLAVLIASVAVAAVVIGGVLASQHNPRDAASADAGPLPSQNTGTTNTPTPSQTPPSAPTSIPSTPPTPGASETPVKPTTAPPSRPPVLTGPTTVTVKVAKLPKGKAPQVPYLVGRQVRGGSGDPVKIPGSQAIRRVGRLGSAVLAVVSKGDQDSELLKISGSGVVRTAGVSSLVTTSDQSAAAYATGRLSSAGAATKGATVYAEGAGGGTWSLKMASSWEVEVLAHAAGKVYFRGGDSQDGAWKLYRWTPGESAATVVKAIPSPSAVSRDGTVAASVNLINDAGTCSSVNLVQTGQQRFRTCDNWISGFTPNGAVAVGDPSYGDGYCSIEHAAVDTTSGKLLREWKGCFLQAAAEDDQHVLIVAIAKETGGDPGQTTSIIRCSITTGTCEQATAITEAEQSIGY